MPSQHTMIKATQFMHSELATRLAHRVVELESLPHNLSNMPSVAKVKNWYTQSYEELITFPKAEEFGIPSSFLLDKLSVGTSHEGTLV